MHEMAIAEGILNIAFDYAQQNNSSKINRITLQIGEMSGVEIEALNMSFEVLTKDTIAEGAELVVNHIPIVGVCNKCGKEFHIEHYNFFCPECDGILILKSGRELQVESLDME
ncbi:MAG: hydrogenase maturation nickel metallochaperone HypA [Selenomonadaceae bacterium]|nr:hydrogenase maturation nickel metallochaperone HypA [Selenomonadaceae bacterium]MBR1858370.1 hydrogenase maturation nickel metallochaperone HypA [Selenomonadaceae bacterium]